MTAIEKADRLYDVILIDAGDRKIYVIKLIREVTGLDLKHSSDVMEWPPAVMKTCQSLEDAMALQARFEAEHAVMELRPSAQG
jgi:large subunit ribosomal protein L7/L12